MTRFRSRPRHAAALALAALTFANLGAPARGQDKADAPDEKAIKEFADTFKDSDPKSPLVKAREGLAADPLGARFRLDKVTADAKAVKVHGVMLVPGAPGDMNENWEAAEKAVKAKVIDALRSAAGEKGKGFSEFELDAQAGGTIKAVRGEKLPHVLLQAAANKAGAENPAADALRFEDTKFDAQGRLVISGRRGSNAATADWIVKALPTVLKDNAAATGPDEKPAVVATTVEASEKAEWPMSPSAIRKAMARHGHPSLARVRVDRAYLVATPGKVDETNPTGTNWEYVVSGIVIGTKTPPDKTAITEACAAALAAAQWAPIKEGNIGALLNADNRVPDPGPFFQKAVAETPALDGVRIDDRTEFGDDGRLVLNGVRPELDEAQLEALTRTVRSVVATLSAGSDSNPGYRKLAEPGVSPEKLKRVRVAELRDQLLKWAEDKKSETRLTRLYFDDKGTLTLLCDSPDPTAELAAKAELKRLARGLAVPVVPAPPAAPKGPDADPKPKDPKEPEKISTRLKAPPATGGGGDNPKDDDGPGPVVKPSENAIKASLVTFLQKMVSDPEKRETWKNVLIERGVFNRKNEYVLFGVVETESQRDALAALLKALATDEEWKSYFSPKPAAAPTEETVPVISMAKLVGRATRVMPAYRWFDGVRVTDARYVFTKDLKGAEGQTLVFDAQAVGRMDPAAAERLRALIAADTKYYARRLPKDRPIRIEVAAGDVTASDQLGNFTEGLGALALARGDMPKAREWVDAGVLHAPHLASVWFLSAYQNHVNGDRELVRRDLFRMIELEDPLAFDGPNQRKRRYRVAKDIQGETRDSLEKFWMECWKEYKGGPKPLVFAEPR